jgi:hypothetical protein
MKRVMIGMFLSGLLMGINIGIIGTLHIGKKYIIETSIEEVRKEINKNG